MDEISETNSGFYVKLRTTGKSSISIFQQFFGSID